METRNAVAAGLQKRTSGWQSSFRVWLHVLALIALIGSPAIAAEPIVSPEIRSLRPHWSSAVDQFRSEIAARKDIADSLTFTRVRRDERRRPRRFPALVQLNAATSTLFNTVGQSALPVLLPVDTPAFLGDRLVGNSRSNVIANYLFGFRSVDMFEAGPAGYDAVLTMAPGIGGGLPSRVYARPVEVHVTGSRLIYSVATEKETAGESVKALSGQYPDIRRFIREGFVRYAFTRFGVAYVVSVQCLDSVARARRLSCREASRVAEHALKNLHVVGGKPALGLRDVRSQAIDRPAPISSEFTYRPPGDLIANSGYRRAPGRPDWTSYAQIRFPLEAAPAFANSQSFLNWGDCYLKGRSLRPVRKTDSYHCKLNDKRLVFDESAAENYAYPWQDNFCETRDFQAGQCPGGFGHQGQDIRPASCTLRDQRAERCLPDRHSAVAVRDAVVIRAPKQQSLLLLVNGRTEHIRFRYMHMNPQRLDADRLVHGRRLAEGERIGLVSNYQGFAGGTTTHLHFDVQVFTREGWIWVNPYTTLIAAYERLLGVRGREISPEMRPTIPTAEGETLTPNARSEGHDADSD